MSCQQEYDDFVVEQRIRGEASRAATGSPALAYQLLYHDIGVLIRQIDRLRAQSSERAARDLLAEIIATYDHSFPPSGKLSANYETMLLIVDMANLVRRARAELGCEK